MRGLLAGALFGTESLVPLMLQVQHRFSPTAAALPLVVAEVTWAASSWWQGHSQRADAPNRRVLLIRSGFALVVIAIATITAAAQPGLPGWLTYPAWGIAGLGAGLVMPSLGILLLSYTTDAQRGADSAALQLADSSSSALTTGIGGVIVAAAARGLIGYTAAFTILDVTMISVAAIGMVAASRARPPALVRKR
jgi:hypothetical protein